MAVIVEVLIHRPGGRAKSWLLAVEEKTNSSAVDYISDEKAELHFDAANLSHEKACGAVERAMFDTAYGEDQVDDFFTVVRPNS